MLEQFYFTYNLSSNLDTIIYLNYKQQYKLFCYNLNTIVELKTLIHSLFLL